MLADCAETPLLHVWTLNGKLIGSMETPPVRITPEYVSDVTAAFGVCLQEALASLRPS